MSVAFRQRTPGEYGRILWRRKWLLLLPTLAIFFAIAIVVWRLPDVYQSSTLLVVKSAAVSSGIVQQLTDEDLTIRINNIGQQVTSRSSLEPLIIRYDLYAAERRRGEPMDLLIERMRKKDIALEINKSRNDITNGFSLSFKAQDRSQAQQVTGELATKYINEQLEATRQTVGVTKDLIDQQVVLAKADLDNLDKRRLELMTTPQAVLPSQVTPLSMKYQGLQEEQKARISEVGRLRDLISAYTNQLADIEKNIEFEKQQVVDNTTDPKTTPAWADLSRRESELEAQYQDMLTKLKPKNPDVIAVKHQLDSVRRDKQQLLDDRKVAIAEKEKRLAGFVDPRFSSLKANIELAKGDMARQQSLLDQASAQIAQVSAQLGRAPGTEVALQALENEYKGKKTYYDDLIQKQHSVDLASASAEKQQGETLAVIDPANLPEKPVAPKRALLMLVGLGLGLGVGLALTAAAEVPRLLTIQTVADARHYTNLPVLVSVPELLTPREQNRRRLRRMSLAVAGVAAAVLTVPALALLLKLSHVFEIFAT